MSGPRYAELQVTTHFSFLRGASSCDELFARAAELGIAALGIVDRNSLAGVVRALEAGVELRRLLSGPGDHDLAWRAAIALGHPEPETVLPPSYAFYLKKR